MTAQPDRPGPDTGSYEVIHLGDQAAVVVPVADFRRLRALEKAATAAELEDAEDTAAVLEWKGRDAAGQTTFVPASEARRGWACPGEPASRLRRTSDQPVGRVPRRLAGHARCWTRSTDWPTILGPPGAFHTGRRTCGGCGSAGIGSCMRSPRTRSRSGTSPAAPQVDVARKAGA